MSLSKRPSSFDQELGRAWDALLEGDPEPLRVLDADLAVTAQQFHGLDDAPAPPAGLMEQVWRDVAAPAVAPRGRWARGQVAAWTATRALVIAAASGMIAGAIAGGLGARVIMRIAALMADPRVEGTITSEGQRVGEISASGTFELMMTGATFGIVGGVLYLAVRPCLPWTGVRRGLVFGLLMLGVLGSLVLDKDNPDYRRIGSPELNVCLFSLLYLVFGAMVAPLADRFDQTLLVHPPRRPPRPLRWLAWLGLTFAAVVILLGTAGVAALAPAFGALLVGALLLRWIIGRRVGWIARPADLLAHPRAAFATYALMAVPTIAGIITTLRSVGEILNINS